MWSVSNVRRRGIFPVLSVKGELAAPIKVAAQADVVSLDNILPLSEAQLIRIVPSSRYADSLYAGLEVAENYRAVYSGNTPLKYQVALSNEVEDYFSTADSINDFSDLGELYIMAYAPYGSYTVAVSHTCTDIQDPEAVIALAVTSDELYIRDTTIPDAAQIEPSFLEGYTYGSDTEITCVHRSGVIDSLEGETTVFNKRLTYYPTRLVLYENPLRLWSSIQIARIKQYICYRAFSLSDFLDSDRPLFYINANFVLANV